jgi:ribosomal protein S18 acetylase RimI-like enzyme
MIEPVFPGKFLSLVRFRHVTQIDLPALEWEGEYAHFRRMYLDAYRRSQLGEAILWVVEHSQYGLIGQLFVHLYSQRHELADGVNRAYIYGFRIRPSYRSLGLGTRLLEVAEQDLVRRGFTWAVLNVGRDNLNARRLYERLGYHVVAGDPGRWSYLDEHGIRHDVTEPAWRMEKRLELHRNSD